MARTRFLLVLACLGTSFLGGASASLLFRPRIAEAQDPKPEKVLKAQRFEIVGENDKCVGYLGLSSTEGPTLLLGEGPIFSAGLSKERFWINKGTTWTEVRYDDKAKRCLMQFAEGDKGVVWTQP